MKTLRICLATVMLTGTPLAMAQDEPGMFTRTMRGIGAFFGAEADVRADGRFTTDEAALIRAQMRADAQARAEQRRAYEEDRYRDHDDDDYDDDEDGHKGKKDKHKKDKKHHKNKNKSKNDDYYSDYDEDGKKPKKLPPGLKKKLERGGELPPGWQRKFERGEVVSDEVWAQSRALPSSVLDGIQQVPGTEVIQVGDRVARVLTGTREIIDVIDLVTGP